MNKFQTKIALQHLLEDGECYSMNVNTLSKKLGITPVQVIDLAHEMNYNVFGYMGVCYVGCKTQKNHYYSDKLLGQNPFYQTT